MFHSRERPSLRLSLGGPFLKCFLDLKSKESPGAQFSPGGENFTGVTIHQQRPGNAVLQLRQIRLESLALVNLRPGHALALRELSNQLALPGGIKADSQDFKTLLAEACIGLNEIRHFRHTRTTPGCPEIEQHELTQIGRES